MIIIFVLLFITFSPSNFFVFFWVVLVLTRAWFEKFDWKQILIKIIIKIPVTHGRLKDWYNFWLKMSNNAFSTTTIKFNYTQLILALKFDCHMLNSLGWRLHRTSSRQQQQRQSFGHASQVDTNALSIMPWKCKSLSIYLFLSLSVIG